ncbi:hypothetical protein [Variovorax sp. PAMC26660]|uniref:hypothetical protein n=1 Tax=Variovorax sp. PAMC26660 TaxID=2762322 RepID=UPI00164E34D0|nr:hypothetical protein [Variovorax sp. PAMC26660]QNK67749.1 hypothetical protein H7F35_32260 [Variovorax sp. PAMC26660]
MQDWLKKLFTEPQTLGIIVSSALVGLFAGLAQGVVEKRHGGWGGFFRAVLTGVAVAVFVGLGIEGFVTAETLRLAIVGACAVVSEDIWMGLRSIGGAMRNDPLGFAVRLLDALRGRDHSARTPPGSDLMPPPDERSKP